MTTPVRLRLSRARGFDLQSASRALNGLPAAVVARPGPWGNPFVVGRHGDAAYCVDLYRALLAGLMRVGPDPDIAALEQIREHVDRHGHELRGHNLACWCRPGAPCHADVLLDIVNAPHLEPVEGRTP
jgi:hypothetical protein